MQTNHILTFMLAFFVFTANATDDDKTTKTLIDRAIFFDNPEISGGQLSPDGQYVSFMKEYEGIMNIWVKAFNENFDEAKLLTTSSSPLLGYFWTDDSKQILYANDEGGNENLNIFSVNPYEEVGEGEVPASKNLTPIKDIQARIFAVSEIDPDMIMVGLNDRDKAWHDLYSLKISTGELTKILENDNRYTSYIFDWDENMRMVTRTDEQGNSQILKKLEDGSFEEVYNTNVKEQAYVAGFNKDNSKCYLVSNKGDVNLSTLYTMDMASNEIELMESDPEGKVDFGSLFVNNHTREIIATSYTYDKRKRYFKNKSWEKKFKFLTKKFPNREVGFTSFTKDYSKMLVIAYGDKYASEVYFFDSAKKELILQYIPNPRLKAVEDQLSTMQPISYKSSDGLEIPAYLSLPKGTEAKNLPLVVMVHGGPKGPRDTWGFSGSIQFLNNRGYAVLQPNFRASGGYGKAFLNAGDKQWGKLMQDDITWGVKHLIAEGIADKDKVAIMGASYGGYATLAGLAFTPDVYTCGIDIVGPSNLFTLLESVPAYWEAGRQMLYEMVGDPNTEEGQKLMQEASPLFSADKINDPLLIVQGANDPRVKKAEADQIAIALRDKNQAVDYLLAADEGHGFRKPLNSMAMYAKVEEFLAKHLGGQYQKEMPEDVSETLELLTVNIDEVVLKEKEEIDVMESLPEIKYDWNEKTIEYDMLIEVQGQKIPMTMERTIAKDGDSWMITDETNSQMGATKDMALYSSDFKIMERIAEQAGQKMSLKFDENTVILNAMDKEQNIEYEGLLVNDGPGFDMLLASMNMNEGDKVSFYVTDIMKANSKQMLAEHLGTEEVRKVDCYLIKVRNIEDENDVSKIWIDKANSEMVKMEQKLPASMGGAILTTTRK